ncbi:UNVERIFIED_CONTAM: hypothetical protein RMT77_007867 [Armadillidium vulgare]
MLSRYSLNIVRTLRNLRSKRVISEKITQNVIPLSEDELVKLNTRNEHLQESAANGFTDVPTIDKSNVSVEETFEPELELPKKSEKKKLKFQELLLQHPLVEAVTEENQYEYLEKAVTPLNKYHYQKQLRMKQRYCEDILKALRKKLKLVDAPMSPTVNKLPCPLEDIIPSPDLWAYRNKDKFSVHTGADGNPKTVGFYVGNPKDPLMRCVPPTHLINIRESHKKVQEHFQSFIRNSPYETCTNFKEGGVWRGLWVRSNLKGDVMGVIVIYPSITPEEKEKLKEDLKDYFFSGPGSECGLSSLYLQACPRTSCSKEVAPFELIAGELYLTEECLGKTFRISPDSFFQTNTKGAELLFDSVKRVSEISPLTTVLDVCCGTGIASIMLAPHSRGAVGLDHTSSSIEDAVENAKINGVRNVNFTCGKVEKVLPVLSKDLESCSDVVAVVNPGRSGLPTSVVHTLRLCKSVNKVIYITCKPEGNAMKNMFMLGSTVPPDYREYLKQIPYLDVKKFEKTAPFALRYAIPVDMFPHTSHIEFVLMFERLHGFTNW